MLHTSESVSLFKSPSLLMKPGSLLQRKNMKKVISGIKIEEVKG
jgi:hypothetical protein